MERKRTYFSERYIIYLVPLLMVETISAMKEGTPGIKTLDRTYASHVSLPDGKFRTE